MGMTRQAVLLVGAAGMTAMLALPARAQVGGVVRKVVVDKDAVDPAVSPDGQQVAVSILGKLWLVPVNGGEASSLTTGLGWDTHPAWSPDGRFIAYAHQLAAGTDLVVLSLATGGARFVYHTEAGIGPIAFHPKGGELFFVLDRSQYDAHVWRVPVRDGAAKAVTSTSNWHEWSFALSPDGSEMFLESGRYGGSDLYSVRLDSVVATRLTNTPLVHEYGVALTPDGTSRLYIERHNGEERVMLQPVAGGVAREVYRSPYDEKQLAVLPDGRSAIMSAGRKLYRLDFASGAAQPIPFRATFETAMPAAGDLLITNARVWDGTGAPVRERASVLVRAGRIAGVSEGASAAPAGVPVIDAHGRTLVPGLMDNHYHYWSAFDGAALLARGITTIRDPGVDLTRGLSFKDAIALGLLPGPTIYTAGPLIDGPGGYHPRVDVALDDPAAAAGLVRSLKAQGVDLLKVYFMLEPDVLRAVIVEAKRQGLPVTGHLGVRTSWSQAIAAGINGLNHIRVWRNVLPPAEQPDGSNESLDSGRDPVARMQADWHEIDPDGPAAGAIIDQMVKSSIGFDPTLSIQAIGDQARSSFSLEQFANGQQSYERMSRFVARAQRAGVRLLAGTDDGSLFDEMESYAKAGVPADAVLRSATVSGAEWLGKSAEFGTIAPGRRGDMVLVDGDPLQDVHAMRNIALVVKDGRVVFER